MCFFTFVNCSNFNNNKPPNFPRKQSRRLPRAKLHNTRFASQARRTRHFARSARRAWNARWFFSRRLAPRARFSFRAKCRVRLAWLMKRLLCRLAWGKLLLPVTSRRRALVGIKIFPHFVKQFEFCLTFSEMIVGSLGKDVFQRWTSTGSRLLTFLGSFYAQSFKQIVPLRT